MTKLPLIALIAFPTLLPACIAAPDAVPSNTWSVDAATKFVRRGMVQVDDDVLQLVSDTALPLRDGGVLGINVFGNLDLHDDIGDSWFPGDNGGRFSEIDFTGSYTRALGSVDLTAGVTSYNLPHGAEFAQRAAGTERGSTTEAFATVATDVAGFRPQLAVHYDFDEVDGFYLNGEVSRAFVLDDKFSASLGVSLGYSDEDQSFWNNGLPESLDGAGFADLQGTGRLFYLLDEHTTIQLLVAASTIVDDDIEDWFDVIEVDSEHVWTALGVAWSF